MTIRHALAFVATGLCVVTLLIIPFHFAFTRSGYAIALIMRGGTEVEVSYHLESWRLLPKAGAMDTLR
jgi:hypothetical protein